MLLLLLLLLLFFSSLYGGGGAVMSSDDDILRMERCVCEEREGKVEFEEARATVWSQVKEQVSVSQAGVSVLIAK